MSNMIGFLVSTSIYKRREKVKFKVIRYKTLNQIHVKIWISKLKEQMSFIIIKQLDL